MTMNSLCVVKSISCPEVTVKAAVSFAFMNAVRFFSALRFYFYGFYYRSKLHCHLKEEQPC